MRASAAGRIALVVVVAAVASGLTPGHASAESTLWSLTLSPSEVTTGVATTFSLTATNQDPLADLLNSNEIGCVTVDVPSNFSVASAGVTGSSAGGSWGASRVGNRVTVRAGSDVDRLEAFEWVSLNIGATALSPGSQGWSAHAIRQQDCTGTGALLRPSPVVVATAPAPTPTPTPRPTVAPTPTPTPTLTPPTPTPTLPLPTLPLPTLPLPTLPEPTARPPLPTPSPNPLPTAARPSPSPTSSPFATASAEQSNNGPATPGTATASPTPSPSSSPDAEAVGGAPPESGAPAIRFDDRRLDLSIGTVGLLDGVEVWAVPAAAIGGPGFLVLLWVALQAAGAAAWLPAARRLKDADAPRSPRRS
jgi:hypothetical protein